MPDVAIISAPAEESFVVAYTELASKANDDMFADMLGRRWQKVLRAMYCAPRNDHSHEYVRFALVDGEIAGMMCAYSGAQKRADSIRTAFLYLRHALWQAPRVLLYLIAMAVLMRFMDHVPQRTYYVAALAIYKEHRRAGIASKLLQQAEVNARELGCTQLAVDVSIHNTAALTAARRYGFTVHSSSPVIQYSNRPSQGVHRMVKPL